MIRLLIAAALLCGDPETPVSPSCFEWAPDIQAVAIQWEILDPREADYVLTRPDDFTTDLVMLQKRRIDLAHVPFLDDCQRFPSRSVATEMMSFNRAYFVQLQNNQDIVPYRFWELQQTITEVDQLYEIWDWARDSRMDYFYITVRRNALRQLRDLIGEDAYYRGQMPPAVPLWRFEPIR